MKSAKKLALLGCKPVPCQGEPLTLDAIGIIQPIVNKI